MTITTSPSSTTKNTEQRPTSPGGGTPGGRWPGNDMDGRGRRPSLGGKHGRALMIVLGIVAVLALAVPIGLSQRSGGGASDSEMSPSSITPGLVQRDAGSSAGAAGSGSSAGSGASNDAVAPAPNAPNGSTGSKVTGSSVTSGAAAALDATTKIARTAWLGLEVTDLAGAAGRARIIASGAGGTVLTEEVVTAVDPVGDPASGAAPNGIPSTDGEIARSVPDGTWPPVGLHQARLTLSVPAEKLDGVLTQLSALGTVSYRSAQAQDVTATYIDTQARIAPARDSITRVRALMAKATDLQQVLVLESELTRRQADLDALTQQLADLEKRTSTSEVTVAMWTPAAATVEQDGDVTGGLRSAWQGLLTSLTVILTGLAVLLPWLLLLGLIAYVAVRIMRRRRLTGGPAVMAPAVAPAPAPAPPATPAASTTTTAAAPSPSTD